MRNANRHTTDEERRTFLRALGVGGAVAVGGVSLDEVRGVLSGETADELESVGGTIRSDLAGDLDPALLASGRESVVAAANGLPAVVDQGPPADTPRAEFDAVSEAGRPVYEHLLDVGFFGSTTNHLPEFTPSYLRESVRSFVRSGALATPLADLDLAGQDGIDLVTTVVANAERISDYHWVATDEIDRERLEIGEHVPSMTRGTAGGTLLWLGDVDEYLWKHSALLTDDILADAVWHGRAMAAGFTLMTESARAIADGSPDVTDGELGALVSTGFALQAIAQNLLPEDVYWVTEEMRGERRTDLETAVRN